ncbi:MAG TPA: methyltransferase domain-containing protein, partial [Gammaproteobacteria bacterium]|nr:methyltransferase domain-containing protein [Gammaproteobacteria bacterium]
MKNYHLGINLGHDRAAALVRDGEIIVAIHQERLDRKKHSIGFLHQSVGDASQIQLPLEAIHYCLDTCKINMSEVTSITANMPGDDFSSDILKRTLAPEWSGKIAHIPNHHLAHAYTAYWPSGFEQALVMVADASGSAKAGKTESYTLYHGNGSKLIPIHREKVISHLAGLSTLGFLYEYVTRKADFVTQISPSLSVPEAGKLMGLAPFGSGQENWQQWIHTSPDSYHLDISPYDIFLEIAALEKRYDDGEGKAYLRPYLVDLAYKIQHEIELALRHIIQLAIKETGLRKLCLAGGVALNSVANYKLYRQLALDDIFIFPAAGDAGIAAGCALWAYANKEKGNRRKQLRHAALGRTYTKTETQNAAEKFSGQISFETLPTQQIVERCAQALAKGHIIARLGEGSEFGPRALGHRSILADPTFSRMKDIINARVKFRESFRPFAPVIPEASVSEVFEQDVAAPFMLLVSDIKKEYHDKIPSVTHHDGTGRVQTVTAEDNAYLYQLCYKMVEARGGPPVVLNTSFNVAGQPIVETPEEAIETFLSADIDYLCLENLWITKTRTPVLDYEQHLSKVKSDKLPRGLPPAQPTAIDLMQQLDRALFFNNGKNGPWTIDELRHLSSTGGRYKETSKLFPDNPFKQPFKTQLSNNVVLMLDPLGKSKLVKLNKVNHSKIYSLNELKWLMAVHHNNAEQAEAIRLEEQLTTLEAKNKITGAQQQLADFDLAFHDLLPSAGTGDTKIIPSNIPTLAAFDAETFQCSNALSALRDCLKKYDYSISAICGLLNIESLQHIEPTHLHYYDAFKLPQTALADLIRLFLLRGALTEEKTISLFGNALFSLLARLGILISRESLWSSAVDLYCAEELFIATDHRYMFLAEDKIDENPVMYIGMDSLGLVCTAPRSVSQNTLDLCSGSGIQALVASRYSHKVTGVDLNPRALRFARFNAQLNGIKNVRFKLGNLYAAVKGQIFDTILANPPFVPSPNEDLRFRDGGKSGEEVLRRIVKGACTHLSHSGKLHIVTDLVDLDSYQTKLCQWWGDDVSDTLVLHTADRNDALFAIPHAHHPFGQSFQAYNKTLTEWINNFHA